MIYADEFLLLLKDINKTKPCEVSKYLIAIEDELRDITYIDVDPEDEMITFVSQKKLNYLLDKLEDKLKKDLIEMDVHWEVVFIKQHIYGKTLCITKMKVGRFIKKISNFNDKQVEIFVNIFKGFLKAKKDTSRFHIVEGEDIRKYYLDESYCYDKGQLGASCMRHQKCQKMLDIYVNNPDICKLLILKGFETDNIMGRALIWTLDDGKKYLDRVYTNLDSDMFFFEEYAKTLGCVTSYEIINDSHPFVELKIKPVNQEFDFYPFMDTFRYYYPYYKTFYSEIIVNNDDYYELSMSDGLLLEMASSKKRRPPLRYLNTEIF